MTRIVTEPGAVATGSNTQPDHAPSIRSHPPPHAGCPRGDPGPLSVLARTRSLPLPVLTRAQSLPLPVLTRIRSLSLPVLIPLPTMTRLLKFLPRRARTLRWRSNRRRPVFGENHQSSTLVLPITDRKFAGRDRAAPSCD